RMKITSGIIGVSLGDYNTSYELPENETVKIILNHPPRPPGASPVCVFLNFNNPKNDNVYGVWDSTGCNIIRHELEFTECECSHLTNFAILLIRTLEFKEEDSDILDILSNMLQYIVCISTADNNNISNSQVSKKQAQHDHVQFSHLPISYEHPSADRIEESCDHSK
ncbi:GPS domain-containing protein, partial [Nephila pilipes]